MKHPRYVHLFFAATFYGFLAGAGAIWIEFGCPRPLADLFSVQDRRLTYGLGIGCGLGLAVLSSLLVRVYRPARVLEQEFGWLLGNQRVGEIFLLAAMSGVAEELLFRGALHQQVGPVFASVAFALAHPPFNRRLAMWPVFALAVGFLFSYQFEVTGNLVAPILTHSILNLVNLLRISAKYRLLEE
jgi:membrane protease YdiL (CAAX protease family)